MDTARRLGSGQCNSQIFQTVKISMLSFTLFIVTILRSLGQNQLSPETLRFIAELNPEQQAQEAASLSPEERSHRINEIKVRAQQNPAGKITYRETMAVLGDEESLQQLVREFVEDDGKSPGLLAPMQNPRIIELVAPEFFREEPMQLGGGDVIVIPRSYRAAELAVQLLADSPAFNVDVINWARGLRGLTFTELRELIRPWWKENEKFFREKDYKSVHPGPERPRDPMAYLKGDVDNQTPATPIAVTPAPPISSSPPLASASVAAAVDSSSPSVATLWTCAAAAIALLVGLVVFWKRRPS